MQSLQEMDIDKNSYTRLVAQDNQFQIQSESLNKIHPLQENEQSEIILVIPFDEVQQQEQDNQVRIFAQKIILIWALQLFFQLYINIMTMNIFVFWRLLFICVIISAVIMIYTVINDNPKNITKEHNEQQDKVLFYTYFFADIFAIYGVLFSISFILYKFYWNFSRKDPSVCSICQFYLCCIIDDLQKETNYKIQSLSRNLNTIYIYWRNSLDIFYWRQISINFPNDIILVCNIIWFIIHFVQINNENLEQIERHH